MDLALVQARRDGVPYKRIAGAVLDALGAPETQVEFERLTAVLRTRTKVATHRVVSGANEPMIGKPAGANDGVAMTNTPYRRRIVEEFWYQVPPTEPPPIVPGCPLPGDELDGTDLDELKDHGEDE